MTTKNYKVVVEATITVRLNKYVEGNTTSEVIEGTLESLADADVRGLVVNDAVVTDMIGLSVRGIDAEVVDG